MLRTALGECRFPGRSGELGVLSLQHHPVGPLRPRRVSAAPSAPHPRPEPRAASQGPRTPLPRFSGCSGGRARGRGCTPPPSRVGAPTGDCGGRGVLTSLELRLPRTYLARALGGSGSSRSSRGGSRRRRAGARGVSMGHRTHRAPALRSGSPLRPRRRRRERAGGPAGARPRLKRPPGAVHPAPCSGKARPGPLPALPGLGCPAPGLCAPPRPAPARPSERLTATCGSPRPELNSWCPGPASSSSHPRPFQLDPPSPTRVSLFGHACRAASPTGPSPSPRPAPGHSPGLQIPALPLPSVARPQPSRVRLAGRINLRVFHLG